MFIQKQRPTLLYLEGAGGEQGGCKDRKVDGGKQEDKESGKKANFYFPGLTPFPFSLFFLMKVFDKDTYRLINKVFGQFSHLKKIKL